MISPHTPLSRVAALGIFALLVMSVWVLAISPVLQIKTTVASELTAAHLEKDRLTRAAANLTYQLENIDTVDVQDEIWQARQLGEMTARIQARLGEIARENGVTLRAVTPAAARDMPHVDTTALRIEGEADLGQFRNLILSIEHHSPTLFVERATIRRLNRVERQSEQPLVFFQLDIAAPIRVEGGK
ncbi:MAG: type II secretion system protein GspM [Paracoccaceae bacterium]